MSKVILISIKDVYVQEILAGRKSIELRKARPQAKPGDTILIYTTQPKKAITAIATVEDILVLSPETMWAQYQDRLGIDRQGFEKYYKNCTKAIGIQIKNVYQLDDEILLSAIKHIHPNFSPPQTFKYLNKFATLRKFKRLNN